MRGVRRAPLPSSAVGVAVAVAVALAATAPASALGSYDSKVETGSAVALSLFGVALSVPTACVLAEPPFTVRRVVGRSLLLAGSLAAIASSIWYFASDDPLWIPHAFGWGLGGGLIVTGFGLMLSDDAGGESAPVAPAPAGGAGARIVAPEDPVASPAARGAPAVGLAPFPLPGGGGVLLAAVW